MNLEVRCLSESCEFSGGRSLPIVGVDEPIYRRLPAFLIATADKFAALPFAGETGALFGKVERADANGFYGPCAPDQGIPIGGSRPAPELIIQDELHLISGPLGTIAGVYEIAIDALSAREIGGKNVRPKVTAGTATIRRAERQIPSIFGRTAVAVFRRQVQTARTRSSRIPKPPIECPPGYISVLPPKDGASKSLCLGRCARYSARPQLPTSVKVGSATILIRPIPI